MTFSGCGFIYAPLPRRQNETICGRSQRRYCHARHGAPCATICEASRDGMGGKKPPANRILRRRLACSCWQEKGPDTLRHPAQRFCLRMTQPAVMRGSKGQRRQSSPAQPCLPGFLQRTENTHPVARLPRFPAIGRLWPFRCAAFPRQAGRPGEPGTRDALEIGFIEKAPKRRGCRNRRHGTIKEAPTAPPREIFTTTP